MTIRSLTVRKSAALGVAALGIEAVLSTAVPEDPSRRRVIARLEPAALPSVAHVLALLAGLTLVVLAPKLWRGTRTAVPVAISVLLLLAVLSIVKGLEIEEASLALSLALVLWLARKSFTLGSCNRPHPGLVASAIAGWAMAYAAVLVGPVDPARGRAIRRALHHALGHVLHAVGHPQLSGTWASAVEMLIAGAAMFSLLALRSLLSPAREDRSHTADEYAAARDILQRQGEDSLAPFILRPDKRFHFHGDGVLAYRLIGDTAVISGDPVAPSAEAPEVLASFRELAQSKGWHVVVWAASPRHLSAYRGLGMHAICAGEEAFVNP